MKYIKNIHLAALLLIGSTQISSALDAPAAMIPSGLSGGDTFYIIFATAGTIEGNKTPAEFEAFVNSEADLNSTKGTDDASITWKAWYGHKALNGDVNLSTSSIFDANNTRPIYNLNGDKVADDYADLTDGTLDNAVEYDQSGTAITSSIYVWTGVSEDGTLYSYPLGVGAGSPSKGGLGKVTSSDSYWTKGLTGDVTSLKKLYAISPLLMVPNTTPVITESSPQAVTMSEDGSPTAFALTLNVTDPDTQTLTWSISSAASNGTASVSATPIGNSQVISYTPTTDYTGSDSFIVQVSDGIDSDTVTVNVTIEAVNDAPSIHTNTGLTIGKSSTRTIQSSKLAATDSDDTASNLTFTLNSAPTIGKLWVDANSDTLQAGDGSEDNLTLGGTFTQNDINTSKLKYTALSTTGNDTFAFSLADGNGSTTTGNFAISIVQPSLSYVNTLKESTANDGSVDGSVLVTLSGDTFASDALTGNYVDVTNFPSGLVASLSQYGSDSTQIELTFILKAASHASSDSINDLNISFADGAFSTVTATNVVDSTKSDLGITFFDGIITGLDANSWNMVALSNGYRVDTSTIDSSYITSGKNIWGYSDGSWSANPTVTPKDGLWVHTTGTTLAFDGETNTSNDISNKSAQLAYMKTLPTNKWNLVGIQSELDYSDLTYSNITPNGCSGFSMVYYYDGVNNSWNTTSTIPANSSAWVVHICN